MMRTSPAWSAAAKLAMARLSSDQKPSTGLRSGAYAGQPEHPQPRRVLSGELGEFRREVDVEVVLRLSQHQTRGADRFWVDGGDQAALGPLQP